MVGISEVGYGPERVWADVFWVRRMVWLEVGDCDVGDVMLNLPMCDEIVVVFTGEPIRA